MWCIARGARRRFLQSAVLDKLDAQSAGIVDRHNLIRVSLDHQRGDVDLLEIFGLIFVVNVFIPISPYAALGTYGNVFDGFEVTDSLPIPSRTGAFAARENMTSGALSVRERPFHPANPNTAGVPTS